jgi:hypothetical protein
MKTKRMECSIITAVTAFILLLAFVAYKMYSENETMIASFSPYNFTDKAIENIYVNGTWAGNVVKQSGGGGGVCCAIIPVKWKPDFFVDIRWQKEDESWHSQRVAIPEYQKSASLQILFFDNDKVKVYVMDYWPCSDKHPMPKETCTEK